MSHSVAIKTQFKNRETLFKQFEKKGWKLVENAKCTTYPSDPSRNDVHQFVAKNPKSGGYDVGIDFDKDNNAFFTCDFFDRSIESQLGKQLKDIKQGYSLDEIKKFAQSEDLEYRVSELPTGELVVIAEK
jgi:hypothetical protein